MKENLIQNKTVFITGASSGIGKACAEQFAACGAHLIITARRLDRLNVIANDLSSKYGVKCVATQLNVQDDIQVEKVFKKLELDNVDIDILLNNAGLALAIDKIQDGQIDNWNTMIDTNIKGLLFVTKAALPFMLKKNQGHIINIGSVAGHDCYPAGNVYCATKHAVRAISQSLRMDLSGTAIRVSEIAPGAVETEFSEVRFNDRKKGKNVYMGFDPLKAEDIADAVLYCASRPQHVNVAELVVFPQAQASVRDIYKST